MILKCADVLADRGMRYIQAARRSGKTALACGSFEGAEGHQGGNVMPIHMTVILTYKKSS
jgi:hypothetical protein